LAKQPASVAETVPSGVDGLPEALYERLLCPDGWLAYRDTRAILAELHELRDRAHSALRQLSSR